MKEMGLNGSLKKEKSAVLYVHGKGGSVSESEHYVPLFPNADVSGLDYRSSFPPEAGKEISVAVGQLKERYAYVDLIANSIGAFFSMHAGIDREIRKAYFISPVVDMEELILGMMDGAGVSEAELKEKRIICLPSGEELSWDYLFYVRKHPAVWNGPLEILYGSKDVLTSRNTMEVFAEKTGARLTVMEGGEHWFHTEEQMRFLDRWIRDAQTVVQ